MDEAPKDGTPVLLKDKSGTFIVAQWRILGDVLSRWVPFWHDEELVFYDDLYMVNEINIDPVGWWPLPDA